MAKVYTDQFGDIERTQLTAYKKANVSPSDHWDIKQVFGEDFRAAISHVRENSKGGMYQPKWGWQNGRR